MSIPTAILIGMFAMDAKIIDFSINGQEIGFMMLFLALTLNALMVPSRRTILKLGLAWAGLMWTRPDGFIYAGTIAISFLLFNAGRPIAKSRLSLVRVYLYAGLMATILYLPWFLWAWHYYGTAIPHTVAAKGLDKLSINFGTFLANFLAFPLFVLAGETSAGGTFLPTNILFWEGWHFTVYMFSRYLSCICALYWCLPFGRPEARAASLAFMINHFYLSHIAAYAAPWYIPNCTILAIFVFSHIVQQSLAFIFLLKDKIINDKTFRRSTKFIHILSGSVLVITLLLTLCSAYQLRIQQKEIENGHRKKIGLWLKDNAASTKDTVFLEPLGYIGFFSQLKMYDYPGLCSPEVVAARKKLQTDNWGEIILELRPDWLVLRPWEIQEIKEHPLITHLYYSEKVFDVSERIKSYRWLPGRSYLEYDETYIVFKLDKNQAR
jgi:hypothetical protein